VHEIFVAQRRGKNTEEKKTIAKNAMELINEGDVIFLDISTTNSELINLIKASKLNVTVVTNMIDIMLAFNEPTEAKLVFVGGALNRGRDGFVGGITNKQMESFRFDKAFLGAVGVDLDRNRVYTYRADDALTKSAVQKASGQTYIMLEERKFTTDGNYMYSKVDEFTGIVTDKEPEQDILDKLKKYDMKIFY
jgi:DeoR family glycerol-3-phosphate regulon repressor